MRRLLPVLAMLIAVASPATAADGPRRLVVHIDSPDPKFMAMGLHNAENVAKAIHDQGGDVTIEIVANGPAAAMFVDSLSPVKDDIKHLHATWPKMALSICAISLAKLQADSKQTLTVIPEAHPVPSGALRVMELQEQHWSYLKP